MMSHTQGDSKFSLKSDNPVEVSYDPDKNK